MSLLLAISFLAGVLTVFAPCIFPLLPVIIGGSSLNNSDKQTEDKSPYWIILSLAISIIIFTLIIKLSFDLFNLPQEFWIVFSGVLVMIVGLLILFPNLWHKVPFVSKLFTNSNKWLYEGTQKSSKAKPIFIGIALAPAFTSCSPTYFLILATILPNSLIDGLIYLFAYTAGVAVVLLLVALASKKILSKLNFLTKDTARKVIGVIILIVGFLLVNGYHKQIETFIIDKNLFIPTTDIELNLLDNVEL